MNARLTNREVVEAILGPIKNKECNEYGPSVLAIWRPRFDMQLHRTLQWVNEQLTEVSTHFIEGTAFHSGVDLAREEIEERSKSYGNS